MRVKKLEIFGFKSFANRQVINFGKGVTGVVGPNGCGKSNVVDALRWVMGEQNARHLRGSNMQDIIFCGSEKKAPLGFAEVILTIDNDEQDAPLEYNHFNEIEITRRLYKTGESEYEINRQRARLKDISDFFLGTGVGTKAYSIIEQGRVNDIVSAKPSDRRLIIEEAAGITKYKSKKAAAERRMEATRINLNRIIDIKNEVDKRVLVLQKEKDKLLKVHSVKQKIQMIDLHIASHKYLAMSARVGFLQLNKTIIHNELLENNRSIAAVEQRFSKILLEYTSKHEQKRLLEDLERQHQATLELLKKDLDYTKTTLNDNRQLAIRILAQLDDIATHKRELERDRDRFTTEQTLAKAEIATFIKELADKKEAGIGVVERRQKNLSDERDTQRKIVEAATTAARLQAQINGLRELDAQKIVDIKNLELELGQKADEITQVTMRLDTFTRELSEGMSKKNQLQNSLNENDKNLHEARNKDSAQKQQLRLLEQQRMTLSSRLTSLIEIDSRLEWSDSGISQLLASEHRGLVKAIVADVIKAKPGHEDTVEKCLNHILDEPFLRIVVISQPLLSFLRKRNLNNQRFFLSVTATS